MLLPTMYLIAIVAEAMTAALSAGRRQMDWVGVCLLGCVTALAALLTIAIAHLPRFIYSRRQE